MSTKVSNPRMSGVCPECGNKTLPSEADGVQVCQTCWWDSAPELGVWSQADPVKAMIDTVPRERWMELGVALYIALDKILEAQHNGAPITPEMVSEGREAQGKWDEATNPIMEAEHDAVWGPEWRR